MSRLHPQDLRALVAAFHHGSRSVWTDGSRDFAIQQTDLLLAELKSTECDCHEHEAQVCDICQGTGGQDEPAPRPCATLALSEAVREATMAQHKVDRLTEHLKRADETVERMAGTIQDQAAKIRDMERRTIYTSADVTMARDEGARSERERIIAMVTAKDHDLYVFVPTIGAPYFDEKRLRAALDGQP